MSWKSIVTAGLLCVLVSPAFAAPQLQIDLVRSSGTPVLAANGDWQWIVRVAPDPARFVGGSGSLGLELGLDFSGAALTGVTRNMTNFPFPVPADGAASDPAGTVIFGWEQLVDVDPSPTVTNMRPVGLQTNPATGQIFAALGSVSFNDASFRDVMTITTAAPVHPGNLTTAVQWLGAFSGNARISQDNGDAIKDDNFDTFSGTLTKTVLGGDANFTGAVNNADVNALGIHFNQPGFKIWTQGDFNGTGNVNNADVNILGLNFNQPGITPPGGGGLAIPEPASVAMCLLGMCAMGLFGRRRS